MSAFVSQNLMKVLGFFYLWTMLASGAAVSAGMDEPERLSQRAHVRQLIESLDESVFARSLEVLEEIEAALLKDPDPDLVRLVVERLENSQDRSLDDTTVDVLARVAYNHPTAMEASQKAMAGALPLLSTHAKTRLIRAIGLSGRSARDVAAPLRELALSPRKFNFRERHWAAASALRVGGLDSELLTVLLNACRSAVLMERRVGYDLVGFSEVVTEEALEFLKNGLSDDDVVIRTHCASALQLRGEPLEAVLPVLIDCLKQRSTTVATLPYRHGEMKPSHLSVASNAIRRIGAPGHAATRPLTVVVRKARETKDPFEEYAAVMALGAIGPNAEEALPTLTAALKGAQDEMAAPIRSAIEKISAKPER